MQILLSRDWDDDGTREFTKPEVNCVALGKYAAIINPRRGCGFGLCCSFGWLVFARVCLCSLCVCVCFTQAVTYPYRGKFNTGT